MMMMIEQQYANCKTPQELYDALPEAVPLDDKFLTPVDGKKGYFKFDKEIFLKLPVFQWQQLYNLNTVEAAAVPHRVPGALSIETVV